MKGKMDILKIVKAWILGTGGYEKVVERHTENNKKAKKVKKVVNHEPIEVQPTSEKIDIRQIESMSKKQLEAFAREEFNVDLDRRHNKKRLLSQIRKLIV